MIQAQSPSPVPPSLPDPEVNGKPKRRTFTAEYKLRVLNEAESCRSSGEVGALLRREGLYSSHLTHWRQQREDGALSGLAPRKRGRKLSEKRSNPLAAQVGKLQKENRRLQEQLRKAELIIEVQKKLSITLGITLPDPETITGRPRDPKRPGKGRIA